MAGAQDPDAFCAAAEDEQTALRARLTAATERLEQARRGSTQARGAHVGLHAGGCCRGVTLLPARRLVMMCSKQGGRRHCGVDALLLAEVVSPALIAGASPVSAMTLF